MLQVSNSAWSDLGFLRRCRSRILRSLKGEKARSRALFQDCSCLGLAVPDCASWAAVRNCLSLAWSSAANLAN
jgi:hypothetical protein